ncbi:mannose-6-phosphate isomerase [Acetobacter lambici]|uniref:AGE family epimerase/isomerase n=1 Tax=Acetobacter lambici TaxID=1332824 RepID=A0ABT1EZR8_9PROT|nr:AGE family epimerase/isomerase [Acetobacter lambici]MCP1242329.1 AGE family epimerase/isomerase [Acetobacter lambici]MCP1258445.1 AGE family epimerase/isomerase [Acetobacter lambici]NHO56811.1 mannose-6-phosphate isomerase [Acetobacter lambici]
MPDAPAQPARHPWRTWLVGHALPLWSGTGYNPARHLYHERLTFDATPLPVPHLRLMVQARQIATFCQARLDGVFNAADNALRTLAEVQARYWQADGQPGWVFALGPDGRPSSTVRDLYAHAFILFAHAWAYRLSGDRALLTVAQKTVEDVERIFHAPHGGFADAVPAPDATRRQNPHMHLLEAYLALFEVTADQFYLDRARPLVALALDHFISPHSGLLLEFFGPDWTPCKAYGQNPVEPGHLFEWSWLLGTYARLHPTDAQTTRLRNVAGHLFQSGRQYGVTHQLVRDGIMDDGTLTHTSTRIWPQTELLRLLASRQTEGTNHAATTAAMAEAGLLHTLSRTFLATFAPAHLHGGWIDRMDADGTVAVDHMPASSLYHIYGAARALLALPTQP